MAYRRKQGGAVAADEHRSSYPQDSASPYSYTSFKSIDEPTKLGLWETLARKAKGILDEDGLVHKFEDLRRESPRTNPTSSGGDQVPQSRWSFENHWKPGDAASRIRPEALSASVNQLSGRIRNAFEEGLTMVDHKTSSIIQETKKIQIRRKPANSSSSQMPDSSVHTLTTSNLSLDQTESAAQGTHLKASRDVANAMAAKAKLLLRELKSVKADLAFAKQQCAQLEEENKLLRETKQKGSKPEEDDDLIRVQLETLLAEKSRLAQENSTYARENRFLREIVEFHQFTTHEVVTLDNSDMEEDDGEEDSNLICTANEVHVVEENPEHEELSHVPSRPESPTLGTGKTSSLKSSSSHSVVDSSNNVSVSEQMHQHLSDRA